MTQTELDTLKEKLAKTEDDVMRAINRRDDMREKIAKANSFQSTIAQ